MGTIEERTAQVLGSRPSSLGEVAKSFEDAVSSLGNVGPSSVAGLAKTVEGAVSSAAHARPLVPATTDPSVPAIPLTVLDAPTQRAYAVAVYVALWAWKLYDYSKLIRDDADSLFYFMKWTMIDGLFMYGLPALRIPWLEWSGPTSLVLFVTHAVIDWLMMFRIPIPIESWLVALTKILYDRELAVSERKVNPADIVRDSDLILGKYTIHVLPEGSAIINPSSQSYCLDSSSKRSITIPIRINQTAPVLIELARFDLDDNTNETLTIPARQARAMKKSSERRLPIHDTDSPLDLQYEVKKPGLYRLQKVVDESGLEVRRRHSEALVVTCPTTSIESVSEDKCKGDLSDMTLQLRGTPPFKLKFSRTVNDEDKTFSFQSIQPENLVSPLMGQKPAGPLVLHGQVDLSWAQVHKINVPLNESLNTLGAWVYTVDEVQDACGNSVEYSTHVKEGDRSSHRSSGPEQAFIVRPRPRASLKHRRSPCVLEVARGRSVELPINLDGVSEGATEHYTLTYRYTPLEDLSTNGEHAPNASIRSIRLEDATKKPEIVQPGLYSLLSVSSGYCPGEILEPTSCLLLNPPEPSVVVNSENIYDSCGGNPIGLLLDLDLTGSPPFVLQYTIQNREDRDAQPQREEILGLRHQLELKPSKAGHYIYRFDSLKDSVYEPRPISRETIQLEQDVKPPASAWFTGYHLRNACLDTDLHLNVTLEGEAPWSLEYEIIHGKKRQKHQIDDITENRYSLSTGRLQVGGQYNVALVSVQDRTRCKVLLDDVYEFGVRQQRPKAGFGLLEGKSSVMSLEGKPAALPLRLTGSPEWTLRYRKVDDGPGRVRTAKLRYSNDILEVDSSGTYELVEVHDRDCPGTIDETASTFTVEWVARPKISVSENAAIDQVDGKYVKPAVCEGDEDTTEIVFSGTPPYTVKYQQKVSSSHGSHLSNKEFTAGLGVASIDMETSTPGDVEYRFTELADRHYGQEKRQKMKRDLLVVKQRVHAKPSAAFGTPGRTYKLCKEEEEGEEVIPLVFSGVPPFYLEIGIKHHSQPQPEIVRISDIQKPKYDFRIPHRLLSLGRHIVSIRTIRDAKGCQRRFEYNPPHVLVSVADAPSILPLESRANYCVGEWISYTLSGTPPFNIFYTFQGAERKATASTTSFRRIAESPGQFTITAIADQSSNCRFKSNITKTIHPMPSVKISKGRETVVDIHEGGTAEILFEFSGTPPFEFTYTRSSALLKHHSSSNKAHHQHHGSGGSGRSQILETKSDISTEPFLSIRASEEGTYEAVAIKDRFCAFSKLGKKGSEVRAGGYAVGGGGGGGRDIGAGAAGPGMLASTGSRDRAGGGGGGIEARRPDDDEIVVARDRRPASAGEVEQVGRRGWFLGF